MSATAAIPASSIVTAISKSTMYNEIVEATFMGSFTDLVTCLHTSTESWDYTGISGDGGDVFDIYGTAIGGADFRLAVTCVAF